AAERAERHALIRMGCGLLSMTAAVLGDWDEAEEFGVRVDTSPRESMAAVNVTYGRGYAAYVRGRFAEARAFIESVPPNTNARFAATVELGKLQLDLMQGTDSGAAARLAIYVDDARRRGYESAVDMLGWGPGAFELAYGDADAGAHALIFWY